MPKKKGVIVIERKGFYGVRAKVNPKRGEIKTFELLVENHPIGNINPYTLEGDVPMDRDSIERYFGSKIDDTINEVKAKVLKFKLKNKR